MASICSDWNL